MTTPVTCKQSIAQCSQFDQTIASAALEANVRQSGDHSGLSGPTQSAVEKRQTEAVGKPLDLVTRSAKSLATREGTRLGTAALVESSTRKGLAGAAAKQSALRVAAGTFGLTLGIAYGATATAGVGLKTIAEGKEQQRAYARDAQNLAVVRLASNALDPQYVKAFEAPRSKSDHGAVKLMTELYQQDPAAFASLKAKATAYAEEGARFVNQSGLATRQEVMALLASDPVASRNYDNNSAFRAGVESALFTKEQQIASGAEVADASPNAKAGQ